MDHIYGKIYICPVATSIIETPEFQRLKKISQLGALKFIHPSANHSRFEHSIGTYFLARKLMRIVQEKYPEDVTDDLVLDVSIAGLLHDVGHGPFSHTYEEFVKKKYPNYKHEMQSVVIARIILDRIKYPYTHKVLKMISPGKHTYNRYFDLIVANTESGFDVDKMDYIQRDHFHIYGKAQTEFDYNDILKNLEIVNDRICLKNEAVICAMRMFKVRISLVDKMYKSLLSIATNTVLLEIMTIINSFASEDKNFDQIWSIPSEFIKFTDDSIDRMIVESEDFRASRLYFLISTGDFKPNVISQQMILESNLDAKIFELTQNCVSEETKQPPKNETHIVGVKLTYSNEDLNELKVCTNNKPMCLIPITKCTNFNEKYSKLYVFKYD